MNVYTYKIEHHTAPLMERAVLLENGLPHKSCDFAFAPGDEEHARKRAEQQCELWATKHGQPRR